MTNAIQTNVSLTILKSGHLARGSTTTGGTGRGAAVTDI